MTTRKTNTATTKTRPTATRTRRATASRRAPPKATKKTKSLAKSAKPAPPSLSLATLPDRIAEIPYVARTRSIIERRQKREARLRADTRRELQAVLQDMKTDAQKKLDEAQAEWHAKVDPIVDKARATRLGHEVERIPERVTDVADEWLDKVGLVRKARLAA